MNMIWKLFISILLMLLFHGAFLCADDEQSATQSLRIPAVRVAEKVTLDGRLDEPFWKDEYGVSAFVQRDPDEGKEPTQKTMVDIVYDDEAIYIGARMYDNAPKLIEARLQRRDVMSTSDRFMFYVDPYFDRRTGFYFGINAAGTLYDGTLLNDTWDDSSWDGVWEGKAHIDEKGWTAEMRIPFSQLRFQKKDVYTWGVNFKRVISRNNENDLVVYTPKNGSGFVSRFPSMSMEQISPGKTIQLLPYVTSRGSFMPVESGDPFHDGAEFDPGAGADLMMGIGSGLTLNATLNPDFGQVEVDPAVVNLSDVETFYPEKRPFFIEGSSIFEFGSGGATNYWGFNWANPQFFYSRRIGRKPQGSLPDDVDYTSIPDGTTIIGAGKLSGKIWDGWNIGTLSVVTAKENAMVSTGGASYQQEVEPATYYEVSRAQREFRGGRQGLGFITTYTGRFFDDPQLKDDVNGSSLVLGVDGWTFLDSNKTWVVSGYTGFSRVSGNTTRITDLQEASQRYFQRPDADYVELDPNATSLSGSVVRATVNKEKGNIMFNSAIGFVSPGFELNDLGFLWRSDQINMHAEGGYKWTEPAHFYRYAELGGAFFQTYDFGGDPTWRGVYQYGYTEFKNYYTLNYSWAYNPQTINNTRTRGGPKSLNLPGFETNLSVNTDSRKKWVFGISSFTYEAEQEHSRGLNFSVEWKPVDNISISAGPSYETLRTPAQWIDNFVDPVATNTYGSRYVFGALDQRTAAANLRLNWTFTPKLSLQLFGQPLISSGDYANFGELAAPKTYDFNRYDPANISLVDGTYTIDPDGPGPAQPFSFDNPDFNIYSLRGNAVLRWEYRPGSAIYLVWTQSREDSEATGEFRFGQSLSKLAQAPAENIIMVKLTYYWNF